VGAASRPATDSVRNTPPIIHAVTDEATLARPDFVARARVVMGRLGARGAVHLRGHHVSARRLEVLAGALVEEAVRTGCWLVVNDRLDIALAVGATAVQLTSRSLSVRDARQLAPALPIGASIHDADEAAAAARDGADWVVAGHVFATPSHIGAPPRGSALVESIAARASLPCIAIGGVRPVDIPMLLAAGAHGVAAIRGIWGADDAEGAAGEYLSAYDGERHRN